VELEIKECIQILVKIGKERDNLVNLEKIDRGIILKQAVTK
jgi:hypothetical protein